jgi:hypothetical protein
VATIERQTLDEMFSSRRVRIKSITLTKLIGVVASRMGSTTLAFGNARDEALYEQRATRTLFDLANVHSLDCAFPRGRSDD